MDPTVRSGFRSPWCQLVRTLKTLALVCRGWNSVATRYLYGDIVFRRAGQIPALVQTLVAKPHYCAMVNTLTFACYVPELWDQVTNESISYLLKCCPNVQGLALHAIFTKWLMAKDDNRWRFNISRKLLNATTSITNIEYYYPHPKDQDSGLIDIIDLHAFAPLPNVTTLSLIIDYTCSPRHPHPSSCILNLKATHLQQIRCDSGCFMGIHRLATRNPYLRALHIDMELLFLGRNNLRLIHHSMKQFPDLHIILNHRDKNLIIKLLRRLPRSFSGKLDIWASSELANPTTVDFIIRRRDYPELDDSRVRFIDRSLDRFSSMSVSSLCEPVTVRQHAFRSAEGVVMDSLWNAVFKQEEDWDMLQYEGEISNASDSDYETGSSSSESMFNSFIVITIAT